MLFCSLKLRILTTLSVLLLSNSNNIFIFKLKFWRLIKSKYVYDEIVFIWYTKIVKFI